MLEQPREFEGVDVTKSPTAISFMVARLDEACDFAKGWPDDQFEPMGQEDVYPRLNPWDNN